MDMYNKYKSICELAARDAEVFKNFKRHPDYKRVLEHVSYNQGLEYLNIIKKTELIDYMIQFAKNDIIGNPEVFYYKDIDMSISPTTLRYIKVLADLIEIFGSLDNKHIIEIGGGYGGQCKIIHELFNPESYTIVDLPEALELDKIYLQEIDVKYKTSDFDEHYDLCISNYAFTEIDKNYQEIYLRDIIKKSDNGYITSNIFPGNNTMSRDEVLSMRENYQILPETPLTAPQNFIYMWK